MHTASHFETLTKRKVLILERTDRFISDLRRLVQLLEVDIDFEEKRAGSFDPMNSNYSVTARQLRARRDNLTVTIAQLERKMVKVHQVPARDRFALRQRGGRR
jgi:hypothetical protein